MRPSAKLLRTPSKLSHSLHHKLNIYALAASAGVGMMALPQTAEGKIVYTKVHKIIGPNTTFHLDLNHDGIADFDFKNTFSTYSYSSAGLLSVLPDVKKNAIWGHFAFRQAYASALPANVQVGPDGQFLAGAGGMAEESFSGGDEEHRHAFLYGSGPWANVTNRYLGLKFVIKGKTHFGWARLNVSLGRNNSQVTATLTGYAYETAANRPILTGQERGTDESEDALGRLALGSKDQRFGGR